MRHTVKSVSSLSVVALERCEFVLVKEILANFKQRQLAATYACIPSDAALREFEREAGFA